MASNRHLGRIIALQSLYEWEFRTQCNDESATVDEILGRNIERYKDTVEDTAFIKALVSGVIKTSAEIDEMLQPIAPEWPIEQIARVDRTILRMAIFELKEHGDKVPPKVAINEAVELAKAFGSDNSSKFVNGVLGTAYRALVGDSDADAEAKS